MPQMLIFGENIMGKMSDEKELWQPFQKEYTVLNFAVGGERTDTLLYRIRYSNWGLLGVGKEGMRDETGPLIALIMIGTDDVSNGGGPDKVALGIDAVVQECITKIPHLSHIFLLSILPRALDSLNAVIDQINHKVSEKYADSKLLNGAITAVDLSSLFKAKDGSIKLDMYTGDRFHLSNTGYSNMVRALRPLLDELFVAHRSRKSSTSSSVLQPQLSAQQLSLLPATTGSGGSAFVATKQESLFQNLLDSFDEQR